MEKYKILIDGILDDIKNDKWEPGSRLPSENKLADQYGVSRHTVRRAIQELASQGIVEPLKGSGLYLKKKNSSRRLKIAYLTFSLDTYIFPSLIQGLSEAIPVSESDLLLYHSSYDISREKEILQIFLTNPPDGLIFTPLVEDNNDNRLLIRQFSDKGIPVVFLDNFYKEMAQPFFGMDDFAGGEEAGRYIYEMGHRNAAIFYSAHHLGMVLRSEGFQSYFSRPGETRTETLDINQEFNEKDKNRVRQFLTAKNRPEVIFCANDLIAVSVKNICRDLSIKIPDNISLLGFDDSPLAEANRLDSFKHPGINISRLAGEYIIKRIRSNNMPKRIRTLFTPELVIRGSVKKLNNQD